MSKSASKAFQFQYYKTTGKGRNRYSSPAYVYVFGSSWAEATAKFEKKYPKRKISNVTALAYEVII